jgi:large subunit ribosomal protein L6
MFTIARKPLLVPPAVKVSLHGNVLHFESKKTKQEFPVIGGVVVSIEEVQGAQQLKVSSAEENPSKKVRAMMGTTRILLENLVEGLEKGFERRLILKGVGYKASLQGGSLKLDIGFSHPIIYTPPAGVVLEVPSVTEVVVKGLSKQLVGQVAANIRKFREPEVYKGKGIRYIDENIRIKEVDKKK